MFVIFTCVFRIPGGFAGVCLLDYDQDGDDDIYVTAASDVPNRLYKNGIIGEDNLHFEDVAEEAGVRLFNHNSRGCCFGDVNNDGFPDLLVTSVCRMVSYCSGMAVSHVQKNIVSRAIEQFTCNFT